MSLASFHRMSASKKYSGRNTKLENQKIYKNVRTALTAFTSFFFLHFSVISRENKIKYVGKFLHSKCEVDIAGREGR